MPESQAFSRASDCIYFDHKIMRRMVSYFVAEQVASHLVGANGYHQQ